jgi:6-phosphofructokinase 2
VKSGVGAGDSFVAALVLGLANGWPLDNAARYGVAAAAAAVTTEATELCKRQTVDDFYAQIGGIFRPAA